VKAIAGDGKVALVTSAWHMPARRGLFRKAGVDILPCPADYRGKSNPDFRWTDYSWDSDSLDRSTFAVHESIGYLWSGCGAGSDEPMQLNHETHEKHESRMGKLPANHANDHESDSPQRH